MLMFKNGGIRMAESAFRRFNSMMKERYPTFADAWGRAREDFGETWESEFSDAIVRLFGEDPIGWTSAVEGYAKFCTDALRSQIYFERNGRYKAASYEDVVRICYHNPDFMFRSYLPGMFLTHYVWPHHHRMLQWYRSMMGDIPVTTFAEVGTGCGLYSKETLQLFPHAQGTGYDISQYSLEFTKQVVNAFDVGDRYKTCVQDIIAKSPEVSDFVICQEVLEHLEDPSGFCRALLKMTRPGGHAYITAAMNAGHVDHIYLYRSLQEVLDHIRSAGFEILEFHEELAYHNKPRELTPSLGGALCRCPQKYI
jgi:SAM-dependent methyltransferase